MGLPSLLPVSVGHNACSTAMAAMPARTTCTLLKTCGSLSVHHRVECFHCRPMLREDKSGRGGAEKEEGTILVQAHLTQKHSTHHGYRMFQSVWCVRVCFPQVAFTPFGLGSKTMKSKVNSSIRHCKQTRLGFAINEVEAQPPLSCIQSSASATKPCVRYRDDDGVDHLGMLHAF